MSGSRRGSGHFLAVAPLRSLVRLSLLGYSYDYGRPPGAKKKRYIHVICPERGCRNERWVLAYSPTLPKLCGRHEGGRVRMVKCEECLANPGLHPPPREWR